MNYVACIAEGAAETAIIDILLDHHLLTFDREEMLDEQVLRCRSASVFESMLACLSTVVNNIDSLYDP